MKIVVVFLFAFLLSACGGALAAPNENAAAAATGLVTITNTLDQPIPVISTFPRTPFAEQINTAFGESGFTSDNANGGFFAPEGSTLVIESIATRIVTTGDNDLVRVQILIGSEITIDLPIINAREQPIPGATWEFQFNTLRLYVPSGVEVRFVALTASGNHGNQVRVQFTGYLVPIGAPSLAP